MFAENRSVGIKNVLKYGPLVDIYVARKIEFSNTELMVFTSRFVVIGKIGRIVCMVNVFS